MHTGWSPLRGRPEHDRRKLQLDMQINIPQPATFSGGTRPIANATTND
jgi:hypothetical protein